MIISIASRPYAESKEDEQVEAAGAKSRSRCHVNDGATRRQRRITA
jgi:hypothetical protein